MKKTFIPLLKLFGVAASLALLTPSAHAYVYATDIQINGSLFGLTNTPTPASPATISYRLNQLADLGCTVTVLNGGSSVATIAGGTAMGLNTVAWGGTNQAGAAVGPGAYSISITAKATGFTNWTQISVDTNAGMFAFYPWGIDVDKNTNSPYYGRVVMSCATSGTSGTNQFYDGLYKMNADGSQADEGWYGSAGYSADDGGDGAPPAGQMPNSFGFDPQTVRIGGDDRIYWCDNSQAGAIIACDMLATTNQVVIDEGTYHSGLLGGPHNYQNCPDVGDLAVGGWGIRQFDVAGFATGNPAVYLVDTGDYPSWGVWMFHLTNGASDTNDTIGTQCVGPDLATIFVTGAGVAVDDSLDVFVSQNRSGATDPLSRVFCFTNWNGGVLPPESDGSSNTFVLPTTEAPAWAIGGGNPGLTAIWDTAINSRTNPTMVAVAMAGGAAETGGYTGKNGGVAVLSTLDGSLLETNLDISNWYNGVAFDNVSNVYGCSRSTNLWRVWSPPGGNTNTTLAVAQVVITAPFKITSIKAVPTGGGCSSVTISFTGPSLPASSFQVMESSTVKGTYTAVGGAIITGSAGSYQATFTNCSTEFFVIEHN
jgi:hypothetical protein